MIAYTVGGTGTPKRVAMAAMGNVGSLSTIQRDPAVHADSIHTEIGFSASAAIHSGQDWKFLGVARNNSSSDIHDFSYESADGSYHWRDGEANSSSSAFTFLVVVGNVVLSVDFSNLVPVSSKKVRIQAGTLAAGNSNLYYKDSNSVSTTDFDVRTYTSGLTSHFFDASISKFNKGSFRALSVISPWNVYIHGFIVNR
jgi:hypothetical protein